MSSSPGNYAAMTIAELRSVLTRNGVKVPQSSVKKAVLVKSCRGPSSRDRGSRVSKSSRVDRESVTRHEIMCSGSDLVDVARMFSSDEEEMSESMGSASESWQWSIEYGKDTFAATCDDIAAKLLTAVEGSSNAAEVLESY
ncbi:hypothetical protein Pmar_PMAR013997 [Perkinsus marinus ATCC 50983]|uniref:HeH/LEM domain-containing protein n=1 Tax=Perkinsus marinus (strain ATCC 50983 / TXsc) TaxID=423536 RepID=C5K944_PERM5|nr:hypothetical protein Pmar_PMAR013997 [Perkinsus marinus ATCC 50983]EER18999.1 hypothetical protein Pmar_PMAR013997 [Perkinsus marinus ATCC 50983]|eukprot:XP_002787203.1 hypothetical protein Pmar_PMAR013997 [Perkinsus marinus ATCC 50983]